MHRTLVKIIPLGPRLLSMQGQRGMDLRFVKNTSQGMNIADNDACICWPSLNDVKSLLAAHNTANF